jgi:chromosome segregation ATPase
MKKSFSFILVALAAMSFFSCGNKAGSDAQVDSLQAALEQRNADYQELDEFLTVISSGLDSISRQQSEIFNPGKESPTPTREQIKQDLKRFQQTLKEQRERIAQLEQKLNASTSEGKKMKAIINSLTAELADKEAQIASLEDEINDKNLTIMDLGKRLGNMTRRNAAQEQVITSQTQMLQKQDDQINEGFVKIGTKDELKNAGLLTKKFLTRTKLNAAEIDKNQFRSIDIRNVTSLDINSGSEPKIWTQIPSDSYILEKKSKGKWLLNIIDQERFWSVSKYLIIQTN